MGHDITPEKAGCGITMKEEDGVSGAFFDVCHFSAEDGLELFLVSVCGRIFDHGILLC